MAKRDTSKVLWTRDDIEESERRVREATSASHPGTIQLLQDLEEAYLLAFTRAQVAGAPAYAPPSLFFAKSFQTFRCAARLCTSGYYSQAGALCRLLFEEALLIDYYRRSPIEALDFLMGPNWEELQSSVREFRGTLVDEADNTTKTVLDELEREIRYHRTPGANLVLRALKKRLRSKKLHSAEESLDKIETELNKGRVPSTQELISGLGFNPAQEAKLRRRYEALCHFIHSRRDLTLLSLVDWSEKRELVVGPRYNVPAFRVVAEFVISAGHFALSLWTAAVPALLEDSAWLSNLKKLGVRIIELVVSMQELGLIPDDEDLLDTYKRLIDAAE